MKSIINYILESIGTYDKDLLASETSDKIHKYFSKLKILGFNNDTYCTIFTSQGKINIDYQLYKESGVSTGEHHLDKSIYTNLNNGVYWCITFNDDKVYNEVKEVFRNNESEKMGIRTGKINTYYCRCKINKSGNIYYDTNESDQLFYPFNVFYDDKKLSLIVIMLPYDKLYTGAEYVMKYNRYSIYKRLKHYYYEIQLPDNNHTIEYNALTAFFDDIYSSAFNTLKSVDSLLVKYKTSYKFINNITYDDSKIIKQYSLRSKKDVLKIINDNPGQKIFVSKRFGNSEVEISDMDEINKILDWAAASNVDIKTDGIHINSLSVNDMD